MGFIFILFAPECIDNISNLSSKQYHQRAQAQYLSNVGGPGVKQQRRRLSKPWLDGLWTQDPALGAPRDGSQRKGSRDQLQGRWKRKEKQEGTLMSFRNGSKRKRRAPRLQRPASALGRPWNQRKSWNESESSGDLSGLGQINSQLSTVVERLPSLKMGGV